MKKLTALDLKKNKLSGHIPPEIGNLEQLTRLELWESNLVVYVQVVIFQKSAGRCLSLE